MNKETFLVAPLNWGLGHASRCIPLINNLLTDNKNVIIASDGIALDLLRQEFPKLPFVNLPSYNIKYGKRNSQILAMLMSLPKIITAILREHRLLKDITLQYKINTVISDNRFGMWNKKIHSIYLTHQLMIKAPKGLKFLEPIMWYVHRLIINRYDECYIPDFEGDNNLSGDLSHKYTLPKNAKFINPLSRFSSLDVDCLISKKNNYDIVIIISGPEPQRSIFEKNMLIRFAHSTEKILILQGLPSNFQATLNSKMIISPFCLI